MTQYNDGDPITPSDTVNFDGSTTSVNQRAAKRCDGIHVGGAGVVAVVFPNSKAVNFTAAAGEILPYTAIRVNATETTATLLVALYRT